MRWDIKKNYLFIHISLVCDFEIAILVSDVKDKTQVHNLNGFRHIFQYYYLIDLTWDSGVSIVWMISFYNHSIWSVILQQEQLHSIGKIYFSLI